MSSKIFVGVNMINTINLFSKKFRRTIFTMVEVGYDEDKLGRSYDIINMAAIVINILIGFLITFDNLVSSYGTIFNHLEAITVAFFGIDYVLRIYTATFKYPNETELVAIIKYVTSFSGIIDLISFIPYYLPFFFPGGAVAFRIFRVMRIFKLFRVNAYYDSLNVITEVIRGKAQQLLSSIFIIVMLMVSASLCMYSVEHEAQPEVFDNALTGIWWAASTLLTVGYGDIYPITPLGKALGVVITFIGVGAVAIPTGIISAGFVEQYSKFKSISDQAGERDIHFIKVDLEDTDACIGHRISELSLPRNIIVAAIQRADDIIVPRGDVILQKNDSIIMGAESFKSNWNVSLKEIELKETHPWTNQMIKDLDMSRQTFIVSIRRDDKTIIPRGDLELQAGDIIVLYTRAYIKDAKSISI